MPAKKSVTYGTGLIPTITYSTEHLGGDSYMVTKTTVEMFNIKIPK